MKNDIKKIMEQYRKKLSGMRAEELAREWDRQRELLKRRAYHK